MHELTLVIEPFTLFRIFYISFLSLFISLSLTPLITTILFKYKVWKKSRFDTITGEKSEIIKSLQEEKHKNPLPTMAGVLIWFPVSIVTLIFNLDRRETWIPLFTLFGAGILGLVDDFLNVFPRKRIGLSWFQKILISTIISGIGGWWFYFKLEFSSIHIPAFGDVDLGIFYIIFFIFVLVATANAVNITDGLDGLAGGLSVMIYICFGFISYFKGLENLAIFCFAISASTLSYTWFNVFPARFLMGDTGSLSLGMTLGVVAMLSNSELILPIAGIIFVAELLSSAIQIFSKKVFGKKVFKVAPFHHHLQALGWPETRVTMRLWLLGGAFSVVGIIVGLIGGGIF
ncbi:MAG: phospho-N-acetylmuramoyl-pentapeptide-transferase [Patescibacteria group bacterium]